MRSSSLVQLVTFALFKCGKKMPVKPKLLLFYFCELTQLLQRFVIVRTLSVPLESRVCVVQGILSSVLIGLLHSPVGHPLSMCPVYFCPCPRARTNNIQRNDSIECADNDHLMYIPAHTMLPLHSI